MRRARVQRSFTRALIAGLTLMGGTAQAAPPFLIGAYQDVSQGIDAQQPRIVSPAWAAPAAAGRVRLWAFAGGDCGSERWGEFDTDAFARLNVAAFEAEGRDYIVSTGGALAMFSCDSLEGLKRFVARYDGPRLKGLDFDIEGKQTPEQIDALVRSAAALQQERPDLRISFTLATHAGNDAARRGLNPLGLQVLEALHRHGFERAIINLMAMNYGKADSRWCVPVKNTRPARCDMGRSALRAVENLKLRHGVPAERIALTVMVGENDVAHNTFTPDDARWLARHARRQGLAGLFHWSLGRDQPCRRGEPRVSPRCHSVPNVARGAFERWLAGHPASP